jgi:nicotinamidase-related amidase
MDGKQGAAGTAVIVIDVQVAMFDEAWLPHAPERTLATIAGLIERARGEEVPVIYVRHVDGSYPAMQPGHPGFEVHPAVAPRPGETTLDKRACDAFYGTVLADVLAGLGARRLVVTGLQTDLCIDTFCRAALHRDFDVVLAADGHTTWPGEGITAEQIIAHHNAALANVPHPSRAIRVTPAAEIALAG